MGFMKSTQDEYVEPIATVEYLFIERVDKQVKYINDNQGWISGFFKIFNRGKDTNDNLSAFKSLVVQELNYILNEYENFNEREFVLENYVFYLVEKGTFAKEFAQFDDSFYAALRSSSHNLMIVGKNFDVQAFSEHEIFRTWVKEFCH
jgi:hypothetical protein